MFFKEMFSVLLLNNKNIQSLLVHNINKIMTEIHIIGGKFIYPMSYWHQRYVLIFGEYCKFFIFCYVNQGICNSSRTITNPCVN